MHIELSPIILQYFQVLATAASALAAFLSFKVASDNKRLTEENLRIAHKNRIYTRNSTNRAAAAKHEEMIANHPSLLSLHGVDSTLLDIIGVSSVEAAYLISSFTAGDLYYVDGEVTELTDYRKRLLESPKVRLFWSHMLDNKLLGPSPFCAMVNAYISHYFRNASEADI